jgi:hypothetical protein
MPTVFSPAVGVTTWGVYLAFSVAPLSVYAGDTLYFSGILTETNGTASYAISSKPINVFVSNPTSNYIVAYTSYTCTDGTYTLAWVVDTRYAPIGINYFYSQSSW